MSSYYKKLLLILIPACVGFCLALALGSADEPTELCQLCQNKAIVREAILAFGANPQDANVPDLFDPNYVQHIYPYEPPGYDPPPEQMGWYLTPYHNWGLRFKFIIAEGDMVCVLASEECDAGWPATYFIHQMAIFRIANGKIVEGWFVRPVSHYEVVQVPW